MKNPLKSFQQSDFLRIIKKIKNNKNISLYTIVLDLLFIATFIFTGKYLGSLIPADPEKILSFFRSPTTLLIVVILYPILFYLFIIFIYSAVKLFILKLITHLYEENKISFNRIGKFYLLNISIFFIFILAALILLAISGTILTREFLKYFLLILFPFFLFYLYSTLNISHILFIKNQKNILKKSFKVVFKKINKYGIFIVWDIIIAFCYLFIYNIIHFSFKYTLFKNQQFLMKFGPIYLKTFNVLSLIFLVFIIAFNRIYLYELITKNVLPQHKPHPTQTRPI